ncbi:putative zinc transporter msc2 [Exophiala xenobiotica]
MSATFTLPVAATDNCKHGHSHAPSHTHSHSRSHQRNRAGSRLNAPFPLARIPSESVMNTTSDMHRPPPVDTQLHQHVSPAPSLDLSGLQFVPKRRDSEQVAYTSPTGTSRPTFQRNFSKPTQLLLHSTERYSLLHGILADSDSRRIFYFMILNLCFMVVQSTYGVLTGSLGLISDSIHMFFDCVALLVGVCAAVMSKWPPSLKFPYGYGKVDTLAGLGNGIFLMLISVEIIYEAIERLFTGSDVSRTTELLLVSTLGLLVNLVGIFAFHGLHDHGHGHSHGSHDHDHDHAHHDPDHKHTHSHTDSDTPLTASASPMKGKKAASGHHHGSENMQGIYLHIMADALGSLAVVGSTLLVRWTGWSGWDPLASCLIAILIFASTIPLVTTTTKTLLLSLNSDIEYNLRGILSGVAELRGVVGYTVPKFWLEDIKKEPGGHHHHGHSHGHGHSHKDSDSSKCGGHGDGSEDPTVVGVMHVIASQTADLEDVRERVGMYLRSRKMDVVVQLEREGEHKCWCGGGQKS